MELTYKIGEAATLLNLKTYVLRFWETEFPQIAPVRTEKGQRLYTQKDVETLKRIRFLLHDRGLTIEGARRILAEDVVREERGFSSYFTPAGANSPPDAAPFSSLPEAIPQESTPAERVMPEEGNTLHISPSFPPSCRPHEEEMLLPGVPSGVIGNTVGAGMGFVSARTRTAPATATRNAEALCPSCEKALLPQAFSAPLPCETPGLNSGQTAGTSVSHHTATPGENGTPGAAPADATPELALDPAEARQVLASLEEVAALLRGA